MACTAVLLAMVMSAACAALVVNLARGGLIF
jgi:hypothetical protein